MDGHESASLLGQELRSQLQPPPHEVERPLDVNEMNLREHLLAAQAAEAVGRAHIQHQPLLPQDDLSNSLSNLATSPPPQLQPQQNIHDAPMSEAFAMNAMEAMEYEDDEGGLDGKKGGRRELSNSKRAAQNRAAQRAFRQRKEGYIKKLEEQVRTYSVMEASYKHLQGENYELRAYILQLRSRLQESNVTFPPPPPTFSMDVNRPPRARSPSQPTRFSEPSSPRPRDEYQSVPIAPMPIGSPSPSHQQQNVPPQHQDQHEGYPPPQKPQPPPPQQIHGAQFHPLNAPETHMDPSAVAQLKAAAAAAHVSAPADDQDSKYPESTNDDEQAYTIEAARAAAYAASTPAADGPDSEQTNRFGQLPNVGFNN